MLRTLLLAQEETRWLKLIVLAEIAINGAPIANTEYSPCCLNFWYHPVFWWDLPDRQEPGPGAKKEAVTGIVHRMKDVWRMVRGAFKKEHDRADRPTLIGKEPTINLKGAGCAHQPQETLPRAVW